MRLLPTILSFLLSPLAIAENAPRAIVIDDEAKAARLSSRYSEHPQGHFSLHLVRFDSRQCQLSLIDQADGPGSRWITAAKAGQAEQALAAINGGFFTPEGKPLGISISNGIARGGLNRSSLGSGFYYLSGDRKHAGIARRSALSTLRKSLKPHSLLQSGPMLADRGQRVAGLSNGERRPRSFLAYDGGSYWLIGYASDCTLAELSKAIAGKTFDGVRVMTALNLDGGRSSDLWISPRVDQGGKTFRGFFNKPVRNYLILKPS